VAIVGTSRGAGTNNVLGFSFTFSPASNFGNANSWGVLNLSCDNAESGGVAMASILVTDSLGNTWVRRVSPLYDPGTANQGVEGGQFTCLQDKGLLLTSTVITVTTSVQVQAKAWTLEEVTPSTGFQIQYVTGGVNTGSATTTPTVTTGSITSGDMVIGALFNEQGTGQTVTGDADATNGSWSAQQTAEIGSTAGGQSVSSQRKVVTATATQQYNPTLGVSSDVILSWIQLTEVQVRRHYAHLRAAAATVTGVVAMLAHTVPPVEPPNHDQLHQHRQIAAVEEASGHFLVDHVQVRQRDRQSDPIRIDHAGRYYLVAGRAVEEEEPPVTGTSLFATQQFRQRDKVEDLPPTVAHDLHAYRSPALSAPQRLPYWLPLKPLEAELEEIHPTSHDALHAHRSQATVAAPQRLWFWKPAQAADEVEEIRRPNHDGLHALRNDQVYFEYIPSYDRSLAMALHSQEQIQPNTRHAARLFPHRQISTVVVAPPQRLWFWRAPTRLNESQTIEQPNHDGLHALRNDQVYFEYVPSDGDRSLTISLSFPPEEIRPDTRHAAKLFPHRQITVVAEEASGHFLVDHVQVRQRDYVEEIRSPDHSALLFNRGAPAGEPPAITGTSLIATQQFRQRQPTEQIRPSDHFKYAALYGRAQSVAVAPPQRLWLWKAPTRLDESQYIEQPQHDLHAFRHERVWWEYLAVADTDGLIQYEEIRPDTRHAAKLFPHRQITVAGPAAPQRLWLWKKLTALEEQETDPRPVNHDVLHQFRGDDPSIYLEYITSVDYSIDHPREEIQPDTRHAAKLFPHRQISVAPPPAPQRLWFWTAPTRLDESQTIKAPQHDLHAFRGEQVWLEYIEVTDYSRLHPVEEIRPNTRHADKFFPYRSAAAPVAPPQRVMYWPQPSRLVFAQPPDPRPIDHAGRFLPHRQFALPVLPPQRLPYWPQPSRLQFSFPDPTPIDHAARFLPHRQFALPVAPPQRLPYWPQPSRLLFALEDPKPIDHAARLLPHRQFAAAVAAPQRLWFWSMPRRFEADEAIGPVVHSPYRLSSELPPAPPSHGITPWPLIQVEVVPPPDPRPIDHAMRFYPFRQYLTGLPTTNIVLRVVYFTQQTSRGIAFTQQADRGVDFTQQANRVLEF
jgi:hypothetical protein